MSKAIFPNLLKNEKFARELLKVKTGKDPGPLEHVLTCGRLEESTDLCLNVDYTAFEDEHKNIISFGVFYSPMRPVGHIELLHRVMDGYMQAKYGYIPPMFSQTAVALVHDPHYTPKWEPCEDNEFVIDMYAAQEDPALAEMIAVLQEDTYTPVTALGKAAHEYMVDIWGEDFWK